MASMENLSSLDSIRAKNHHGKSAASIFDLSHTMHSSFDGLSSPKSNSSRRRHPVYTQQLSVRSLDGLMGDHDDDDDDDYDHRNDLRRRREASSTSPKRSRLTKSQSSMVLKQPQPLYDSSSSSSRASNKRIVKNNDTMEKASSAHEGRRAQMLGAAVKDWSSARMVRTTSPRTAKSTIGSADRNAILPPPRPPRQQSAPDTAAPRSVSPRRRTDRRYQQEQQPRSVDGNNNNNSSPHQQRRSRSVDRNTQRPRPPPLGNRRQGSFASYGESDGDVLSQGKKKKNNNNDDHLSLVATALASTMHSRRNPNNSNNSDFGFSDNSCSNDEYYIRDFQTDWDSFNMPLKGNDDSSLSSYLSFANDQGDQEMAATSAAAVTTTSSPTAATSLATTSSTTTTTTTRGIRGSSSSTGRMEMLLAHIRTLSQRMQSITVGADDELPSDDSTNSSSSQTSLGSDFELDVEVEEEPKGLLQHHRRLGSADRQLPSMVDQRDFVTEAMKSMSLTTTIPPRHGRSEHHSTGEEEGEQHQHQHDLVGGCEDGGGQEGHDDEDNHCAQELKALNRRHRQNMQKTYAALLQEQQDLTKQRKHLSEKRRLFKKRYDRALHQVDNLENAELPIFRDENQSLRERKERLVAKLEKARRVGASDVYGSYSNAVANIQHKVQCWRERLEKDRAELTRARTEWKSLVATMQQGQPNDGRLIKMRVRQMDVEERIDEFGRRIRAIKNELSREASNKSSQNKVNEQHRADRD